MAKRKKNRIGAEPLISYDSAHPVRNYNSPGIHTKYDAFGGYSDLPRIIEIPSPSTNNKSANTVTGYSVPQYPFDESRKETDVISWQNMMEIAWLWDCAPAQIRRNGLSVSHQQEIWQPDRFGMACFRNKVKETLVGFSLDDLKELDIHEIIYHVNKQISRSDHKAQKETVTQWQTEFREAYQLGLEHKDHWQDRVREAIKALKQWYEGYFIKGKDVSKAPLPYMDIHYRKPDSEDLPWMYWILGMKLEDVFGIERVFVPEDVKKEMDDLDLYRHIEKPVWSIICFATIEDFKTWWEFIHANLKEHGLLTLVENFSGDKTAKREDGQGGGGEAEDKNLKGKQEGLLEPKAPEFLQKLLWICKYGKKYWKLILLAIAFFLIWVFLIN